MGPSSPLRDSGWSEHGRDTMVAAARLNPAVFSATCARLIRQDVWLSIEQTYGALEPADYAVLRAIRKAIPDANK